MNCKPYYIITLLCLLFSMQLNAQNNDSMLVLKTLGEAEQLLLQKSNKKAKLKIEQAYVLSNLNFWESFKGQAALLLGNLYSQEDQFKLSLEQYLKAEQFFVTANETELVLKAKLKTAQLYTQNRHYSKALIAYEDVKAEQERISKPLSATFWELIAKLSIHQQKTEQGQTYINRAVYETADVNKKAKLLLLSTQVYIQKNALDSALIVINRALSYTKNSPDNQVELHNAKAFILNRKGNAKESSNELKAAISKADKINDQTDIKGTLLSNIGVTYTTLESYSNANYYYTEALDFWQQKQENREVANTYNFIAANYYLSGNIERARTTVQLSIDIAKSNNYYKTLAESYEISILLSPSDKEKNDLKALQLKAEEMANKAAKDSEELELAKKLEIENIENEIHDRIAKQLDTDRRLQQLAFEAETRKKDIELKANELTLLKREKELRDIEFRNKELERQQVKHLLEVTRTNALAEELKRKEQIQKLELSQQKAQQKEREQQIALLENERSLQELQLKEEKNIRKYGLIGFLLIVLILLGVAYSLIISRKHQKKLKTKNEHIKEQSTKLKAANDEIIVQNEELTQYQEELTLQRDNLEKRNIEIDKQNKKVAQSIRSATIIQSAILLPAAQIAAILPSCFVLFKPKDAVSGDFYWIAKTHGKTFIAAIDCTGHGVPGALMSLIGNSILNKIVKIGGEVDPGVILTKMHAEVYEELKQESTGNADGMDMAFVSLSDEKDNLRTVEFAGAKRPLHYLAPKSTTISIVNPDRISIGGKSKKTRTFATQRLELEKGSSLYISSDGYSDQNDINRKRLSTKRYISIIESLQNKPMSEQKKIMEDKLAKHMKGTEQRDDILVIGFTI